MRNGDKIKPSADKPQTFSLPAPVKRPLFIAGGLLLLLIVLWQISKSTTFQFFGKIVARVNTSEKVVALTFDDGPTKEFTEPVLSILREKSVKATFFLTGSEMESNMKMAQKIAADNHEIGNHSFSHPRMVFTLPETVAAEIERTDHAIEAAGSKGKALFRPPYGKKLFTLPWYLSTNNRITVTWDVDPESYSEVAISAEKIVEHVTNKVRPGSIILLHVMYQSRSETRKALPEIIDRLRRAGYQFLTVSELLRKET